MGRRLLAGGGATLQKWSGLQASSFDCLIPIRAITLMNGGACWLMRLTRERT